MRCELIKTGELSSESSVEDDKMTMFGDNNKMNAVLSETDTTLDSKKH